MIHKTPEDVLPPTIGPRVPRDIYSARISKARDPPHQPELSIDPIHFGAVDFR